MLQNKTVAEIMLDQLQAWGVKRIYGVVGDAILGLMDAIAKQNQIQFIAVKHESAAAMMASAEAKLTGGVGVCIATSGPGIANLLNGLGDAYMDQAPVLAITGQVPSDKIGTDYKQYINQQELVKPFALYSAQLSHPDAVVELLTKALQTSIAKGAVSHLSVPKDLFTMMTTSQLRVKPVYIKGSSLFDKNTLQQAVDLLQTATRPMIVAGIGARKAATDVEKLAAAWGAGLLVSFGAKGMLPDTSVNLLGGIGQGGNPYASEVLKQADIVLLVGDTWWPEGYVPKNIRIVQIDYEPANIGKAIPVELGIVGESEAVVPLLTEGLQGYTPNHAWVTKVREAKQKWDQENELEGSQTGSPIQPARIVRAIEKTVQPNAVLAIDTGDVTPWVNRSFRVQQQNFLFSGDWRTMGFGLPAAIAAKLNAPERQVVCIVGDGGIEMVMADLLTAVRYGLKITLVVFNNQALQMERDKMIVDGFMQEGVDLTNPDFVKLADACGWEGYRVETDVQLEPILQQALAANRPSLVDVNTAPVVHPETK